MSDKPTDPPAPAAMDSHARRDLLRDAISTFARALCQRDPTFAGLGFTVIVHSRDLMEPGYDVASSLSSRDVLRAMLTDLLGDELCLAAHARGVSLDELDKFCGDMAVLDIETLERQRRARDADT